MTMKTTTTIKNEFDDFLKNFAFDIMPAFEKDILNGVREIHDNAKKNWLVRSKNSRRSIDKFEFSVLISQGIISGVVRNNAPYAWAIRVGRKSNSPIPAGQRLATILLERPLKKLATQLTKQLANQIVLTARKK